jgi:hypothetical protein
MKDPGIGLVGWLGMFARRARLKHMMVGTCRLGVSMRMAMVT